MRGSYNDVPHPSTLKRLARTCTVKSVVKSVLELKKDEAAMRFVFG